MSARNLKRIDDNTDITKSSIPFSVFTVRKGWHEFSEVIITSIAWIPGLNWPYCRTSIDKTDRLYRLQCPTLDGRASVAASIVDAYSLYRHTTFRRGKVPTCNGQE